MDREGFLRGVAALRKHIATLVSVQCFEKGLTRMSHISKESRDIVREYGSSIGMRYLEYFDMGSIQSYVTRRKIRITAALVTYALVRGKGVAHKVDKYSGGEYTHELKRARLIFDNAVAAVESREQCVG